MKYNVEDNKPIITLEHNIVVQYCFGEYVGSMSIKDIKKGQA